MTEQDFKDLADAGVTLLGEVGLGAASRTAPPLGRWSHGPASMGSRAPSTPAVRRSRVRASSTRTCSGSRHRCRWPHLNGGHTALPDTQIRCICEGCKRGLEIVHNGNERAALYTLRTAREMNELHRVILGTDAHGRLRCGSRSHPRAWSRCSRLLAIFRRNRRSASLLVIPRGSASWIAASSRWADRRFRLSRPRPALRRDTPCLDSIRLGDLPGIGMVVIDGQIKCQRSRNTPPAHGYHSS